MATIPPLQTTDDWLSPLTPDHFVAALAVEAKEEDWAVVATGPGWVQLRGGSRAVFRVIGVFVSYGRKRVPWRAVVHAQLASGGSAISVTFTSDQSAYLLPPIPSAVRAWADRFAALDAVLRATSHSEPSLAPLTLTGGGSQRYAAVSSRSRQQRLIRLATKWAVLFVVLTAVNSLLNIGRFSGGAVVTHAAITAVFAATLLTLVAAAIRRP